MFALEYAALFRGILVWLGNSSLLLPLGGTSNHFRREALERVLGWDPYNVTEDADLGIRLARNGYRTRTLERPTLEDAPTSFQDWEKQRIRWYKGWLQCWLVHMRSPIRLYRDLGLKNFLVAQSFLFCTMFSALWHPVIYIAGLILVLGFPHVPQGAAKVLWLLDIMIILAAFLVIYLLGRKAMAPMERNAVGFSLHLLPIYWLMQSLAAWKAVLELLHKPHYWAKTPHRPSDARMKFRS